MENKIENVVIRNIDASLIYNMSMYEDKKSKIIKSTKELKAEYQAVLDELATLKNNEDNKEKINELKDASKNKYNILIHMRDKNCKLNNKDDRYFYKGTLDDSLMMDELLKYTTKSDFRKFTIGEVTTHYTDVVINLTFNDNVMVETSGNKYRYDPDSNNLIENGNEYNVLISASELRTLLYNEGFSINGNKYVNFQRTSSKARTGNDLFILEKIHDEKELAKKMTSWQRMGIDFKGKQDIVSSRSYETLTSSAIIDRLDIDPNSILLIDDVTGHCRKKCNVVGLGTYDQTYTNKKGQSAIRKMKCLQVNPKMVDIDTDIWDGQSLLDSSLFAGKYKDKGFFLLRNHYAKTAAFNTNITGYFTEEKKLKLTDELPDRFGDKIKVGNIKMITTKNSMKIFKFTDIVLAQFFKPEEYEGKTKLEKEHIVWKWYKQNILKRWGICKYEKASKYELYQQLAYQMINSLNLSEDDIYKLAKPFINHINLINKYPAFFRKYIGDKENDDIKSTMMIKLLMINDLIVDTTWYKNYHNSQVDNLKDRAKRGKILIENTDYAVLFGNPYEMLTAAAGDTIDNSLHKGFECWCTKFDNGAELTGFRSPHILESNSALLVNKNHDEFKWFRLNDNILVVNFFGHGAIISNIWNGCDVDSDSVLVGTNPILLKAVKEVYTKVSNYDGTLVRVINKKNKLVPINDVPRKETIVDFTPDNMAMIDNKLSNDFIGKICNLAQQLQSLYYHEKRNGNKQHILNQIYNDLCLLEVMSNIAIDSAKREYDCNLKNELARIKKRDYLTESGAIIKDKSAIVTHVTYRKNVSARDAKKFSELRDKAVSELSDSDKMMLDKVSKPIIKKSIIKPRFLIKVQKKNKSGKYMRMDAPMDVLGKLVDKHVKRATGSTPVWICDLLADVKYDNVSTNRINSIKEEAIKAKKLINGLFAEQKKGKKSWDDVWSEMDRISANAILYFKKFDNLTAVEICRLIRDVYDFKYKRDQQGKLIKDKNGKKQIERDKRDKKLVKNKAGGYMLQLVYEAHKDLFLSTIKVNTGKSTYVFEDENGEFEDLGKRYSIVEREVP